MDQLRKGTGQPKKSYSELEEEIKILNDIIGTNTMEFEEMYNDLSKENENLKFQIRVLLRCDQCDLSFVDNSEMSAHIQLKHTRKELECQDCCKRFEKKVDFEVKQIKQHRNINTKSELLKRQNELLKDIGNKKLMLFDSLYKLNQREVKQNGKCGCRGRCIINHSKYRWTTSTSNILFNQLKTQTLYECPKCDLKFSREEHLNKHFESSHQSKSGFPCQQCNVTFKEEEDLKCHEKTHHSQTRNEYESEQCEGEFIDLEALNSHNETYHKISYQ